MPAGRGRLPKVIQDAEKASTKQGWTWQRTAKGHTQVYDAQGTYVITIGGTFYDGPLTTKILGRLRKAGCPGVK